MENICKYSYALWRKELCAGREEVNEHKSYCTKFYYIAEAERNLITLLREVHCYKLTSCVHSEVQSPSTTKSLTLGGMIMVGAIMCPRAIIPAR